MSNTHIANRRPITVTFVCGDITTQNVDIIVNAANETLLGGIDQRSTLTDEEVNMEPEIERIIREFGLDNNSFTRDALEEMYMVGARDSIGNLDIQLDALEFFGEDE
jgi:hypothetical protein